MDKDALLEKLIFLSCREFISIYLEKKKTDLKKDRQRNLVPAKIGIYGFSMFLIYVINYAVTSQLVTILSYIYHMN